MLQPGGLESYVHCHATPETKQSASARKSLAVQISQNPSQEHMNSQEDSNPHGLVKSWEGSDQRDNFVQDSVRFFFISWRTFQFLSMLSAHLSALTGSIGHPPGGAECTCSDILAPHAYYLLVVFRIKILCYDELFVCLFDFLFFLGGGEGGSRTTTIESCVVMRSHSNFL